MNKYEKDNGNNISQCQRRKVQTQKGEKLEYFRGAELEWKA